jgi:plastocyanin
MAIRRPAFLLMCGVLGCAVGILPAAAGSQTAPTVNAASDAKTCGIYYPNCWSPSAVELTGPGAVSFQNASGTAHGVVWSSVPVTPACSGVPVGSSATAFNGSCSFAQAGTYRFYCSVHGTSMSGTVTVGSTGTTSTTTGTQPGGSTTSTTQPAGTTPAPPGAPGPTVSPPALTATMLSLARSQRGRSVRGSLQVPAADAGGRLEVALLAKRASLAGASGPAQVQVGRLVRSSLRAGRQSFSVALRGRARGVLARRRRLALVVKLVLTPAGGSPSSATRNVVLHA